MNSEKLELLLEEVLNGIEKLNSRNEQNPDVLTTENSIQEHIDQLKKHYTLINANIYNQTDKTVILAKAIEGRHPDTIVKNHYYHTFLKDGLEWFRAIGKARIAIAISILFFISGAFNYWQYSKYSDLEILTDHLSDSYYKYYSVKELGWKIDEVESRFENERLSTISKIDSTQDHHNHLKNAHHAKMYHQGKAQHYSRKMDSLNSVSQ